MDTSDIYFSTIQEQSIRFFSVLVSEDEQLQKAASDGDAISHLANILIRGPSISEELKDASLADYQIRSSSWDRTEEVFYPTFIFRACCWLCLL
jgi:hypothetical protein